MVESSIQDDKPIVAKWKPLILALMIVALLLRITAAVVVERHVQNAGRSFLIEGDANGYWQLAQNIAAGTDYAIYTPPRRVLRVPGFPLLLAGCIKLFGDNIFAARIVLAVIGTACCWLTYRLGSRLHMHRTGFWAALFVAVNPLHVGNSVLILSETWFAFWMLLSLLSLLWWMDNSSKVAPCSTSAPCSTLAPCPKRLTFRAAITGLLTGIATLVRPGYLPWLAVSCVASLLLLKYSKTDGEIRTTVAASWRLRFLACLGLLTGCFAVMLPWAVRNQAVTGHWIVTSLWSGPSLYDGLNPSATGASDMTFFDEENVLDRMSEYEMNQHYKSRAVKFALQNPSRTLILAFHKAAFFLSPVPNHIKSAGWEISVVCTVFGAFCVVLCVVGFCSKEWDAVGLLVMVGPLLLFLLVHMVFVGSVRYRLPLEFPLAVLAAIGWRRVALRGAAVRR
ncbi:MAG: glycosyltransferase family 39 protein [Planctomycetaceae bacterium]